MDIASAKQLPPTLSAIYHLTYNETFQPYVGIGLNYTLFFDTQTTTEANSTLAGLGLTGADLDMDNSWGIALQIGGDYHFNDQWPLNASIRWIDIDTNAEITFDNGSTIDGDIEIDPWVYSILLGYKF